MVVGFYMALSQSQPTNSLSPSSLCIHALATFLCPELSQITASSVCLAASAPRSLSPQNGEAGLPLTADRNARYKQTQLAKYSVSRRSLLASTNIHGNSNIAARRRAVGLSFSRI
jgi:hypothetical protein